MQQHDSSISSHKLSVAWPNANSVFVFSVCVRLLTFGSLAKDLRQTAAPVFWFVYRSPGPPVAYMISCLHSDFSSSVCYCLP